MCLAVPGRVLSIGDVHMATVDVAGVRRQVCLDLCEGVHVGDFVLVHVGFALQKIDEQQAEETLRTLRGMFGEGLEREA